MKKFENLLFCTDLDGTLLNDQKQISNENLEALEKGFPNLLRHISNIKDVYKLPSVVAVNRFPTDTDNEINLIIEKCKELNVNVILSTVWADGGDGGIELAKEVVKLCEEQNDFTFSYELNENIENKIRGIVQKIYRGKNVEFTDNAKEEIKRLTELGFDNLPICMAKTQYSFSDDMTKLGAPEDFIINPGQTVFVATDVKAAMEEDEVLYLYVRSSVGIKKRIVLANGTGVIDSTYYSNPDNDGNIIGALTNMSNQTWEFKKGERFMQGVFQKYLTVDNDEYEFTDEVSDGCTRNGTGTLLETF